jgi:hypothetical protein
MVGRRRPSRALNGMSVLQETVVAPDNKHVNVQIGDEDTIR